MKRTVSAKRKRRNKKQYWKSEMKRDNLATTDTVTLLMDFQVLTKVCLVTLVYKDNVWLCLLCEREYDRVVLWYGMIKVLFKAAWSYHSIISLLCPCCAVLPQCQLQTVPYRWFSNSLQIAMFPHMKVSLQR